MPKPDLTAAFANEEKRSEKSKQKMVMDATQFFTGQTILSGLPSADEMAIPLEKIKPREVNEFEDVKFSMLEESIYTYGLIQPIIVTKHANDDFYVICSGHRRYNAVTALHNEHPDDHRFDTIDCIVYEVTEDPALLAKNEKYISAETEDAIYRETNLQSRQLRYSEVAKQIRYILKRIEDPVYYQKAKKMLEEESGTRKYGEEISEIKLITSVLAAQNYQGWSREKIRQYLVIRDTGREDLLDRIEDGESVYSIYKTIVKPRKRSKSAKTLISGMAVAADDLNGLLSEGIELSRKEKENIQSIIEYLNEILEDN